MTLKDLPVGWIGVGKMGLPMAGHLVTAGCTVRAYDTVPARLALLSGAQAAGSLADAARGASVVFSSLPDDAALRAVALSPEGALAAMAPGSLYIDTSTVSPSLSAEVAAEAARRGVRHLRVTVSGNNHFAEAATLTVFASGAKADFDAVQPLLARFGPVQMYVGEAEQARTIKLVINLMIAVTSGMLAEALALGGKGGLAWDTMLEAISASAVGSPIVKSKAKELAARDFTPTFTPAQLGKDLDLMLDAAREWNVPLTMTAHMRQLMQAVIASGRGGEDYVAVVKLLEDMAGITPRKDVG